MVLAVVAAIMVIASLTRTKTRLALVAAVVRVAKAKAASVVVVAACSRQRWPLMITMLLPPPLLLTPRKWSKGSKKPLSHYPWVAGARVVMPWNWKTVKAQRPSLQAAPTTRAKGGKAVRVGIATAVVAVSLLRQQLIASESSNGSERKTSC
jgi:hypothetical protein